MQNGNGQKVKLEQHNDWMSKLPAIRFAMNSTPTIATSFSPAYITFGRELRTMDDVHHNLTEIVQNENFISEITPYLLAIPNTLKQPQNGPASEPVKLLRKQGRPPKKVLLHGSGTDSCNSVSSKGGDCNTSTINLTRSGRRVRAPAFYEGNQMADDCTPPLANPNPERCLTELPGEYEDHSPVGITWSSNEQRQEINPVQTQAT
ncbi:hypothetical protein ILUMI_16848 [Ignelater luminosus]|uniref:Uncharacterized protein n=1 Tax=Ignelater luminosus TaxID=2038154 RepID=A0A8K0CL60_IGNLU|nr:hypothetical protein ILUMI_16848 [Ignelater luminosus]